MFLHWQRVPYDQRSAYGNATTTSRDLPDAGWAAVYRYVNAGDLLALPDPTAVLRAFAPGPVALDELTPALARAVDWRRVAAAPWSSLLVAVPWCWDDAMAACVGAIAPEGPVRFVPELFTFGDGGPAQGPEDDSWGALLMARLGPHVPRCVPCFIVTDRPDLRRRDGRRDLSSCEGDPGLKSYLDGRWVRWCRERGVKDAAAWGWGRSGYGYSTPASEGAFERAFLANY